MHVWCIWWRYVGLLDGRIGLFLTMLVTWWLFSAMIFELRDEQVGGLWVLWSKGEEGV